MDGMCGRFSIATEARMLAERFSASLPKDPIPQRFNAAPSQELPVILNQSPHQISLVTWGLIPHWARATSKMKAQINARVESAQDKPMFREAFRRKHCLVLADGFYEWKKISGTKVPYRIVLKNNEPFAFAGIWDEFKNADGNVYKTFAILTTEADAVVAPIHNRMPIILKKDKEQEWLLGLEDASSTLKPIASEFLEAYEVSPLINNTRNDNPRVIEPL